MRWSGSDPKEANIRKVQPTGCNVSQFICFCKAVYMFRTVFPSIIKSSELHVAHQVFVRPILLPAARLDVPSQQVVLVWQIPDALRAVLSSWWWTEKPSETCTPPYRNKINCETLHLVGCTLRMYSRCTDLWMLKKKHTSLTIIINQTLFGPTTIYKRE